MSKIIIASAANWKQLNTSSRNALCILQSETCCGNESENLTTASRPFLVSRRILRSSSGETFLNKSRFARYRVFFVCHFVL